MKSINYLNYDKFDNQKVEFDTQKYPFDKWVLSQLQDMKYDIDQLNNFHAVIPLEQTAQVTKKLTSATIDTEFTKLIDSYIENYLWPLVDHNDIAIQRYTNVRVLLPNRPEMLLPFHSGQLVGHGLGQRTNWMVLTDAFESAGMYIADVESSRVLINNVREQQLSYQVFKDESKLIAKPTNTKFGQSVIFTQENLHGNLTNTTEHSRMSLDFRILLKGGDYSLKSPGGYFRLFQKDRGSV